MQRGEAHDLVLEVAEILGDVLAVVRRHILSAPPLMLPKMHEAFEHVQLPGFRLLHSRAVERGDSGAFGGFRVAFECKNPAFDAEGFGVVPALFPARPLDLRNGLIDESERPGMIAGLGHTLGQHGFEPGTVTSTAARLPAGDGPLEPACPFGGLALPDQNSRDTRLACPLATFPPPQAGEERWREDAPD